MSPVIASPGRCPHAAAAHWLRLGLPLLAWIAFCAWLRYAHIEVDAEAQPCARDPAGFSCALRSAFGFAVYMHWFGYAALALAALAAVLRGRWRAHLALASLPVAVWALMFYNANEGAIAAVAAVIVLALARERQASAAGDSARS